MAVGFDPFHLNRIWLTAHAENLAVRAYLTAGFAQKGLLRSCGFINGRYYDSVIMAILRDEYLAGKGRVS